jgi:hypothetical protein
MMPIRFVLPIFLILSLTNCSKPQSRRDAHGPDQSAGGGQESGSQDPTHLGRLEGEETPEYEAPKGPKFDAEFRPTEAKIAQWVDEHRVAQGGNGANYGYVHIPLNMATNQQQANMARIGIFKALNHVSTSPQIYTGEDISEGRGIAYAIDTRRVWPNAGFTKWDIIARPLNEGGNSGNRNPFLRTRGDILSIRGPMELANVDPQQSMEGARFVYNATFPNIYNELINTPNQARKLVNENGVGQRPVAMAAHKQAIVNGPRVSSFFKTADGRYYISTADYFANKEGDEIPYATGNPTPNFKNNGSRIVDLPGGGNVVSESYIIGTNYCPKYYIWGAGSQERGRAEFVFVKDPQNHAKSDGDYLVTGRSCITCHVSGAQAAPNDMDRYINEGRIAPENLAAAKAIWTKNEQLNGIYGEIISDFRTKCMQPILKQVSNGTAEFDNHVLSGASKEPVLFLIRQIEPEQAPDSDRRRR